MITVLGATGYTGRLVAQVLAREGLPFRIAGRSLEKLTEMSAALPNHPTCLVADATQPATLPALFQDSRMLINLAGPFTDLGERVISQAAMSGVHYLDVTNELGYLFRSRGYSEMARQTGAALVPASGFEVALADCAAQLAGSQLLANQPDAALDEINIVYALHGKGASQGTRRSAIRSLGTSWIAYRDSQWTGQVPGGRVRRFDLPGGPRHALNFPSCESVTVPAHLLTRRVDVWMAASPGARFWAPLGVPLFARLSRSILRPLILSLAARGGFAPAGALDVGLRSNSPFSILVEAKRGNERSRITLQGQDPYGMTAEIAAYAARRMTAPDYRRSGLLSPSLAFDAQTFLDYAQAHWGVTLSA